MSVFHDIKSLKLRASYSTVVSDVRLSDVEMDVAVDEPVDGAMRAMSVEKCECPVKATGDSCEVRYKVTKPSCTSNILKTRHPFFFFFIIARLEYSLSVCTYHFELIGNYFFCEDAMHL